MAFYTILPPEISKDYIECKTMAYEFFEQKGKDSIKFFPFSSSPTPVSVKFLNLNLI